MTDAAHATPGPVPPPPRRGGHGCLWGCLGAALIAFIVFGGSMGYLGWYLWSGYKNDTTLQSVMRVVSGDQVARAVLGNNIVITNLESSSFHDDLSGHQSAYVAHLRGSRADGTMSATVVTPHGGKPAITSLILTGPNGQQYNLRGGSENGGDIPAPTNIDHKTKPGAAQDDPDTGQHQQGGGQSGNGPRGDDDTDGHHDEGQYSGHADHGDNDGDGDSDSDGGQDNGNSPTPHGQPHGDVPI